MRNLFRTKPSQSHSTMISDKLILYAELKTRGKLNVARVCFKCVAFNSHLSCDLFLLLC